MKNFKQLRNMARVFHLYGIKLIGKRKFDNLYIDLQMDQAFVLGLIFELELVTQCQLKEEDAYEAQVPAEIIRKLMGQHKPTPYSLPY